MNPFTISLAILLPCFLLHFSTPLNTITTTRSLQDGNFLISDKQIFALGFFSPINSTNRYLGIWYYKVSEQTIVWVANRDDPIVDRNGVVSINEDDNLVVRQKTRPSPIWSTNMSTPFMNKSDNKVVAKLMDSGNLVLLLENDSTHENFLWQSFDYPTDTMLPFMKLGFDHKTGFSRFLSSWKSKEDPGTGTCSFKIDPTGFPQLFLYKGLAPWWRPGPWTGERLSGVPEMTSNYIFSISFINNVDEVSIMYGVINESIISRMVVNESGIVNRFTWNNKNHQWIRFWYAPKEECDLYGKCGANSNCDPYNADEFACKCLPGFEPKSEQEWYLRDGSGGCVRNRRGSVCRNGEGFVKVERVRLPDSTVTITNMSTNLKECEQECLANCSCVAFTSADVRGGGTGCVAWHGDLIDTRTYADVGQNLYVRVDSVVLAQYAKTKRPPLKTSVLAATLVSAAIALLLISFFLYCFIIKKRNTRRRNSNLSIGFSLPYLDNSLSGNELDESTRSRELCFFSLSSIAAATDNFSAANKLGEGGFGSVYKGKLNNGTEIAVKRLSKYSGQGVGEFKNEVTLIAKLQHRNLVRMIGCCIKDEEKMLIYEYLPNKSLDFFIFDERKRSILDWRKRFDIIVGIARGILYLHQDSRLRIIHRDLKASNVLLDAEMNPKISDFGMARIFGVNQNEANTNRVVGTYGYMSPEYAMEGLFSTKSDVYSFGVLLLEIVTGKKNSSYYHECPSSNLVGHVWELWMVGRAIEVVDSFMELEESCCVGEILRCIQTGLLCVQEVPVERPTMSTVIFMLGNDASLPSPKQPAFIFKRSYNSSDPSTSTGLASSVNEVTVTMVEAR